MAQGVDDLTAEGFFRLGKQLMRAGEYSRALMAFRRVTQLAPSSATGWMNRAAVAAKLGVLNEEEPCLRKAMALEPLEPRYRIRLGFYLVGHARLEEAEALFRSVTGPLASCGLARVHEARGELESALAALAPMIHHAGQTPQLGVTFARLARQLGQPLDGLAVLDTLEPVPIVAFERGHCLDAAGRYEEAWACFLKANESLNRPFDSEAWLARLEAERQAPRSRRSTLVDGSGMVFIVGMPRSGTTLVEQILSRHPEVSAMGEREVVPRIAGQLTRCGWPDLTTPELNSLAAGALQDLPSNNALFTDKMPDNWQHLALIHQLLPGARIVHCRRDALDCLLSNFMQHYASSTHTWSSSLEGLSTYYQGYASANIRGIDVCYEELVSHPEREIPALLDALGLPAHADCLRPHESTRRVATASYAQVQEPIHTRSVGRAEPYRHLMAA